MAGRGCMKIYQWVLVLTLLLTIGSVTAADPIDGVGDGTVDINTIKLVVAPSDASILIIGHLTRNGNALEGTSFFLYWNPNPRGARKTTHNFSIDANGAQIAYILGPNALVNFTISSDQFVVHDFIPQASAQFVVHPSDEYTNTLISVDWLDWATEMEIMETGTIYILPHLPEDPTGQAAIAFF